jgi:hypothetical protein
MKPAVHLLILETEIAFSLLRNGPRSWPRDLLIRHFLTLNQTLRLSSLNVDVQVIMNDVSERERQQKLNLRFVKENGAEI